MNCIKIKKNKKTTEILFILLKLNLIHGWSVIIGNNGRFVYIVYCNIYNNKHIQTILKPSKQINVKHKFLKKLNMHFSSTSAYLNTSCGILTFKEASNKNIGGFLLFQLV
jgi:ribosomal protein S8